MKRIVTIALLAACAGADELPPAAAPSITTHPVDASVVEPGTATFVVTAAGDSPLTYRWERKRAGDTGFTPIDVTAEPTAHHVSYVTPATQATDDLIEFRVVVSNPGGSVTSSVATFR